MRPDESPRPPRNLLGPMVLLSIALHGIVLFLAGPALWQPPAFDVVEMDEVIAVNLVDEPPPEILPEPEPDPEPEPEIVPEPAPEPPPPQPEQEPPLPPPVEEPPQEMVVMEQAQPDYLRNPPPRYPLTARERGWEGDVLLVVEVSAIGRPTSVTVRQSSGHRILDTAAVDAVQRWSFQPARLAGIPVAARVEVPVSFRLRDR